MMSNTTETLMMADLVAMKISVEVVRKLLEEEEHLRFLPLSILTNGLKVSGISLSSVSFIVLIMHRSGAQKQKKTKRNVTQFIYFVPKND